MYMQVMFRRDGRVEIHGKMYTEKEACAWFKQRGHDDLIRMTRRECKAGRKFQRKRGLHWFDSEGVEHDGK